MAGNLNPYDDPGPWGTVQFVIPNVGTVAMPGVIESIDGCEKPENWIIQMGIGSFNGVTIWRGTKLAESIKIKSRIYSKETFDACYALRDALCPKVGKKPPTAMVVNGQINFARITRVSYRNFIPFAPAAGLSWTWGVDLVEYNPMKPAPVGPADPPKAETENDKLQKEAAALRARAGRYGPL
jgi:hypothetical protein